MSIRIIPKLGKTEVEARNREERLANVHRQIDQLSPAKPWQIEIKVYVKPRTDAQNRYFHAVILRDISAETGNDVTHLKACLMGLCFGTVEIDLGGKQMEVPVKGTSDLNVSEFNHLIDWSIAFAARECGLEIPYPNEIIT
jgi:hypothetical protein